MTQLLRVARLKAALLPLLIFGLSACEQLRTKQLDLTLPDTDQVAEIYSQYQGISSIELSGNVVVLRVEQSTSQLQYAGGLWAQLGPYVYLLSPATRNLFITYPGVAAVRVITVTGKEEEVARAMLVRDTMGDYQWQRSVQLLSRALEDGGKSPMRVTDLVRWAEQYADYEYNPAYVKK